jgi:hypothetical protein
MSSMMLSILLYLLLGFIGAVAMILLLRAAPGQMVFRARPVMTDNEIEFFRRLVAAWPDGYVFPQVAMSALLKPAGSTSRAHRAAFNSISQKRVDYAIYSADMSLHCVVELDDRSHDPKRDARRDAWLASAGIVTLRFTQKDKPNVPELKERLQKKQPSGPATRTTIAAPSRPATLQANPTRPVTMQAARPAQVPAERSPTPTPGASVAPAHAAAPARAPAAAPGKPIVKPVAKPTTKPIATAAPAPAPAPELDLIEFSPVSAPRQPG